MPVPGLPAVVDAWRERTCVFKPSAGVPAHVTLLFPFVPAEEIRPALIAELGEVCRRFEGFAFELRELRTFPGTLYLAPEPPDGFVELTGALAGRFPAYKPYRGVYAAVVPHLTFAEGEPELVEEARAAIEPTLPIAARCDEAVVLSELASRPGRWITRARVPLAGETD